MTAVMHPVPTSAPLDRSAAWEHRAAVLRASPGQWHWVRQDCPSHVTARSLARDIREGRIVAFRPAGTYYAKPVGHAVKAIYLDNTSDHPLLDHQELTP